MNKDFTASIYKSVFGIEENHKDVNKFMKAVIINFGDDRGDIIVKNDNFGTNRKYADFTNGKKEAGLHHMQIVFSGVDFAKVVHERYINENDEVRVWGTEEVISGWKQIGGVLIFDESLRIMDDGEYDDYYRAYLVDSTGAFSEGLSKQELAIEMCKAALDCAGYGKDDIDKLMNWKAEEQ